MPEPMTPTLSARESSLPSNRILHRSAAAHASLNATSICSLGVAGMVICAHRRPRRVILPAHG